MVGEIYCRLDDFANSYLIRRIEKFGGEAWLAERDGRKLWAEARGTDGEGNVYVESRALYLAVGVEHFAKTIADMPESQQRRLTRFRSDEYYP